MNLHQPSYPDWLVPLLSTLDEKGFELAPTAQGRSAQTMIPEAWSVEWPGGQGLLVAGGMLAHAKGLLDISHPDDNHLLLPVQRVQEGQHIGLIYPQTEGEPLPRVLALLSYLEADRAVAILLDVLGALGSLQQRGWRHQHIDLQRIWLDKQGRACLLCLPEDMLAGRDLPSMLLALPQLLSHMLTGQAVPERADLWPEQIEKCIKSHPNWPATFNDWLREFCQIGNNLHEDEMRIALNEALQDLASPRRRKHNQNEAWLLEQLQNNQDFPALSKSITDINRIVASETESVHTLSSTILKDFALTQRLIRLVNSARFSHLGGDISTVSRAIVILGFNTVRGLALSLMLFDQLQQTSAEKRTLSQEAARALWTAFMSHALAQKIKLKDQESSFVAGMFQSLGRLLCARYFPKEMQALVAAEAQGAGEEEAGQKALGCSLQGLSQKVAKEWNFPKDLRHCLQTPRNPNVPPKDEVDKLQLVAYAAKQMSVMLQLDPAARELANKNLLAQYQTSLNLDAGQWRELMQEVTQQWRQTAAAFGLVSDARSWVDGLGTTPAPAKESPPPSQNSDKTEQQRRTEEALAEGIQDLTQTMLESFDLTQLLRMVLETIYRSLQCDHVILALKDNKQQMVLGKMGFGEGVEHLWPYLKMESSPEPRDVFQLALHRGVDVFIENAGEASIQQKLPKWYKSRFAAQTFLVLPLMLEQRSLGCIYADKASAHSLQMQAKVQNLLKTLRNQALLGIRSKQ